MAQNRTEIVISALNETQAAFAGLKESLKGLDGQLGQINKSGKKTSQSFRNSFNDIRTALVGTGIVLFLKQLVDASNQVERSNIALATTARYAGVDLSAARDAAKSLTEDGLMSVAEASQALQNLLSRGFSLPEAIELMKRFKDSAAFNRQASLEFGQAVVTATEGLKNENSILVDNAGVTKNVSIMWKEYAAQHGKSVEQLTIAEKRQAEYNGILRETEGQLGNTSRMTETFAGQTAKLNQELFNFKAQAGKELTPVLADIAAGLRPVISLVRDFIGGLEMAAVSYAAWGDRVAAVRKNLGVLPQFGILDPAKRAALKQDLAVIDQAEKDAKQDIFKRFSDGVLPDIGKDSGKRRSDIVLPGKDKSAAKAAKQAEDWRKTYADLNAEIAKNQLNLDEWDKKIIDINNRIDDLLRKPGADKGKLEGIRTALVGEVKDQQIDKAMRDAFKELDSAMEKRAKSEQDQLEKTQQLREAEIQYQLSLVDTAEAYHQITEAEAADKRLALNKELLSVQEQWLGTMDKATDASGWLAQSQAIEETRKGIVGLEKAVEAYNGSAAAGWKEGIEKYKKTLPPTFQQMSDMAEGTANSMQGSFKSVFSDGLHGELKDLSDYFSSFLDSMIDMWTNAMAQMTMASLFGKSGGWGDLISGLFGSGGSSSAGSGWADSAASSGKYTLLGSYATGTDYVPKTGPYLLHQGERVTPAGRTGGSPSVQSLSIFAPISVDGLSTSNKFLSDLSRRVEKAAKEAALEVIKEHS